MSEAAVSFARVRPGDAEAVQEFVRGLSLESRRERFFAPVSELTPGQLERVVSGPGIAHIHRLLHPHQCPTLTPLPPAADLPAAISRAALEAGCPECNRTLEVFVSAYGAAAGNLALTVLATGGLYLGGGIAPCILAALRWPVFMQSFLEKSPMDALIGRIPVKVIMNPGAGLLGAATFVSRQ